MTDDSQRPLKVFLCHAHSDADKVRALYSRLKNDGVDAWLDKENIIAGQDWDYEIRKAVRDADIVIVCLSKQFNQKGYRQNEVRVALEEANLQPEGEIFIIPARLEECDYPESLRRFHGVDLYEERGYDYLMRALRLRAEKIGALLSKKSWLGSFTAPVQKKPVTKKPEPVEKKPAPSPTPRKLPQFNLDRKNTLRIFLGVMLLVVFGISRLVSFPNKIKSPTPSPAHTSTFVKTSTPLLPTLTFTPALPTETSTPTLTPTVTPLPAEITDEKGIRMNLVPAGTFMMGEGDAMHQIDLGDYYMDIYEVTNAAYKLCVYAGTCEPPSSIGLYNNLDYVNHPVAYVNWNQANTYCEWRGAKLPTEAEWEKAARGTDGRTYPWGDEGVDCIKANVAGCKNTTTPIGSYESGKSPYGMYDMAGNVWEWTSSLYKPYPYDANDGREDMSPSDARVLRGGSWNAYFDFYSHSAFRDVEPHHMNRGSVGFRCARTP